MLTTSECHVADFCVICKDIPKTKVKCSKCNAIHCIDCCNDKCSIYGCGNPLFNKIEEPDSKISLFKFLFVILCIILFIDLVFMSIRAIQRKIDQKDQIKKVIVIPIVEEKEKGPIKRSTDDDGGNSKPNGKRFQLIP